MSINLRDHKMLWGRSGNRCAICKMELFDGTAQNSNLSNIGEECHINGRNPDSSRYNAELESSYVDSCDNLILLCRNHHKQIDDQPDKYTIEALHEIKMKHDAWVRESLEIQDLEKQQDDELYASIVDEWGRLCNIDNWMSWSSWVLSAEQPKMFKTQEKSLSELREWLLARIWPARYPELEMAFENFRRVLEDFHNTFNEHIWDRRPDSNLLYTDRFYKSESYLPQNVYDSRVEQYLQHVYLVYDLMLELTRAANKIITKVRKTVLKSYRDKEGYLLVQTGLDTRLQIYNIRCEYTASEDSDAPYPGLDEFREIRKSRNYNYA